jgi:hypothetical protein
MGPIFVGGASRSGKTLVRWMLSSHSRVVVSRRTDMWPRFHGRFGDLRRPENLERCLAAMLSRRQVAALAPDPARIRRDFDEGEKTYARLFALVHEHYAERHAKPRWGDQTALIEAFTDELLEAYEGARIVQMVRDPRDRHAAIIERAAGRPPSVRVCTNQWLRSASLAPRNARRHPGGYMVVHYESLVTRPEETLRALCDFIGEDFEPAMLRMPNARRYDPQRARSSTGDPISSEYVGQYRARLARHEIAYLQAIASREMRSLEYTLDPVRLTAGDRIRSAAIERPVELARGASLRARALLHGARHPPDAAEPARP